MNAVDKALEAVRGSLEAGEAILGFISATRVEKGNSGTERGVLLTTSERIIYRGFALFGNATSIEWRFTQLNGIAATRSMMFEHIEVNGGGSVVKFLVHYGEAQSFVSQANQAIAKAGSSKPSAEINDGLAAELSKLADLFSKGLLSEEEFAAAKRKLIS
jgi:hypothetical protein